MLKLHIQDDEGKTTIVPLVRDDITIGRQEGNTIRLTEKNVSRSHARLVRVNGTVFLEEVRARYGTRINGDIVRGRTSVMPGDVIQIGDYRIALHTQGAEVSDAIATQDVPVQDDPGPEMAAAGAVAVGQAADGSTSIVNLEELGDLLDDDQSREIPRAKRARVMIQSSNVPREEHTLVRSPMVVGRTEENDIQIDHRSISRNHAKLVWSEGTYTVLDMGSANGVKVNGDFYKRADLHHGDELELGHVKLKFVGAGESAAAPLVEPDDLPIAEVAPSNAGKFAMIGLVVVGLVVAALWIFHFSKDPEPTPSDSSEVADTSGDTAGEPGETTGAIESDPSTTGGEPMEGTTGGGTQEASATTGGAVEPVPGTTGSEPAGTTGAAVDPDPSGSGTGGEPVEPGATGGGTGAAQLQPGTTGGTEPVGTGTGGTSPEAGTTGGTEPAAGTDGSTTGGTVEPPEPQLTPQERASASLAAAKVAEEDGDYDRAVQLAGEALAADANVAGGLEFLTRIKAIQKASGSRQLAEAAADAEDWAEVWKQAAAGLLVAPEGSDVRQALQNLQSQATDPLLSAAKARGQRATRQKNWQAALAAYTEALKYDPNDRTSRRGQTKARRELRRQQASAQDPTTPTPPEPNTGTPPTKLEEARALYAQARAAKFASNLTEAARLYKQCLRTHGGMSKCRTELIPILMTQGHRCEALTHMRRYVRSNPGGRSAEQYKRLIGQFEAACP